MTNDRPVVISRFAWLAGGAGWELFVAVLSMLAGLTFFIDPTAVARSAIGRELHPYDQWWSAGYMLAGALTSVGCWRFNRRLECAGLILFVGSVGVAGIATAGVLGLGGAVALSIYVGFLGVCVVRIVWLVRR